MANKNISALKKIKANKGVKSTEQFALDLLRKTAGFGNAEQLDKANIIPSIDPVSKYLPNRIFYWPQSDEREYQTLLIELDKTAKEIFTISAFKQKDGLLEVLEDVLARISQLTLNGFAKERARDASTKWGKQVETLVVLAIKDDHSDERLTQHVVSFATVNQPKSYEESLDIFYVRENSDITDETAIVKQKALLKKRHFDLLNSKKWKDAFVTDKERKSAETLLSYCKKSKPNTNDIIDSCVELLQSMASGYLRGQHNQQLKRLKLHSGHQIGLDSDVYDKSPLQGEAIRDQKDRLLGYIVYCVDDNSSEEDIREFMSANNRFHNVLIIYPDADDPTIELWQGKKRLEGKLRKDKASFSGASKLVSVLTRFFAISSSDIKNPEQLATELAYRARFLKQVAFEQLEQEAGSKKTGGMQKLFNDFKTSLIHTITESEFTDAYAQTLTYGLLSARWVMAEEIADKISDGDESAGDIHFTRRDAAKYLPTSSGFLKQFFNEVLQNTEDDGKVAWILSDIADVLDKTHIQYVFGEGDIGAEDADPIIHFYEPFLNAYDSEERQRRGVYYTPQPVVEFIVRNVDQELKDSFGLVDGLADTSSWKQVIKANADISLPVGVDEKSSFIKLLDPATGTGTFLVAVIDQVFTTLKEKWQGEGKTEDEIVKLWTKYVDGHLVNMLYGFEVMMASYAIAHLKVSLKLRQTGYKAHHKTPFNILLTNTLEGGINADEGVYEQISSGDTAIAEEAERARKIKLKKNFTVIVGNPPYSGHSANKSKHLSQLLEAYKLEPDGSKLKEDNPKYINDDYVKFIRFSQSEIASSGVGVHSFVTNHKWLYNPTFRGVRASLLREFHQIRVIDLHGNIREKETTPSGGQDDNVFDEIQQGVAIFSFVKRDSTKVQLVTDSVFTFDLYGLREEKYEFLKGSKFNDLQMVEIKPRLNLLTFSSANEDIADEYSAGFSVSEIFRVGSSGIKTHRDHLVVDFTNEELKEKIENFIDSNKTDDQVRLEFFGEDKPKAKFRAGDNSDWILGHARDRLRESTTWEKYISSVLYRAFDVREVLFKKGMVDRGRWEVMGHLTEDNYSLVVGRAGNVTGSKVWDVFYAGSGLVDTNLFRRGGNMVYPLYCINHPYVKKTKDLFGNDSSWPEDSIGRVPNFQESFINNVQDKVGLQFDSTGVDSKKISPEDIYFYCVAILSSNSYRVRYAQFIMEDFPRIPFPKSSKLFYRLVTIGADIYKAFMMDIESINNIVLKPKLSNGVIRKVKYSKNEKTLKIDGVDVITGLDEDVWLYTIGGNQVLDKWLKERKEYVLDSNIQEQLVAIVNAIITLKGLSKTVDQTIGTWPIK